MAENQERPEQAASFAVIRRELTWDALIELGTGVVSADGKDLLVSLGQFVQRARSDNFTRALLAEIKQWKDRGRVKDNYVRTDQFQTNFQELLDAIDKDLLDEQRFGVLKKILMVACSEKACGRDSVLPHEYMQVCRQLASGELLVLFFAYRATKKADFTEKRTGPAINWLKDIADNSALKHAALVEVHEEGLMARRLLTPRAQDDRSGVLLKNNRLTDLAIGICDFISRYDEIEGSQQAQD